MKKILHFFPVLLATLLSVAFVSCDDDESITYDQLPTDAKVFVAAYYPSAEIVSAQKDGNTYDVVLSNGHKLEFNKDGLWTDVEAPIGQTVPTGFYPSAIDSYLAELIVPTGINEISRKSYGYDIETLTGLDLKFDAQGAYIGVDR